MTKEEIIYDNQLRARAAEPNHTGNIDLGLWCERWAHCHHVPVEEVVAKAMALLKE